MIHDPIFIVGTERSGSNLLRLILNAHPSIAIPHPPHLMRDMTPHLGRYGDLGDDASFRRLIRDSVELVELHFMPWGVRIDEREVFAQAHTRSLYAVYCQIHDQYLRSSGSRRWGCKSTFMIRHIDEIVRTHESPRIIHLVRDGRDVAVSARKSVFSRFHPHYVSKLWSAEQRLAIEHSKRLSPAIFRTFTYENLISMPEKTVREICSFLGEEFSPGMIRYFEGRAATSLAAMSTSWQNCDKPILNANFGKFKAELSSSDLLEFERISHHELEHFGYSLVNEPSRLEAARPSSAARLRYRLMEFALATAAEAKAFSSDENAMLRLRKRLFLTSLRFLP